MGDSLIRNAAQQARVDGDPNLGLDDSRSIIWMAKAGMKWQDLLHKLQYEMLFRKTPQCWLFIWEGIVFVDTKNILCYYSV